jgi:hypothetical protein
MRPSTSHRTECADDYPQSITPTICPYTRFFFFPSGYTYADGTWTFQKQPPPLTRTMKDPAIVEYMKHPKKRKSGESWSVYWQKRKT